MSRATASVFATPFAWGKSGLVCCKRFTGCDVASDDGIAVALIARSEAQVVRPAIDSNAIDNLRHCYGVLIVCKR